MALKSGSKVRVDFSEAQVLALTSTPGGEVFDWMTKQGRGIARKAVREAPWRTGKMRRSIRSRVTPSGANRTKIEVRCTAPYAEYVHNGTTGPIVPQRGQDFLVLYSNPDNPVGATQAGYGDWYMRPWPAVMGQEANPFLAEALAEFVAKVRSGGYR